MSASTIPRVPCKTALSKSTLPGLMYTFNPYVGCGHGCLYCYVPDVVRRPDPAWGHKVSVKEGVIDALRKDARRLPPGPVGVSTVTDPYQPVEKQLEVTRRALEVLSPKFPVSIQTKSCLVLRDTDIIRGRPRSFEVGLTMTSPDEEFQRTFEPGASRPENRAYALEELSSKGVNTWIFYGPIIPGLNDSEECIRWIIGLARKTRSRVLFDRINLRPALTARMRGVIGERLDAIRVHDFGATFRKIGEACRREGVRCEFAFSR